MCMNNVYNSICNTFSSLQLIRYSSYDLKNKFVRKIVLNIDQEEMANFNWNCYIFNV